MSQGIDSLTRLPDRGAFLERYAEEAERVRRYGTTLFLLLLEIGNPEALTSQDGDQATERALCRLTVALLSWAREADVVARVDASRFAVLLPDTNAAEAGSYVEQLRAAIATTNLSEDGAPYRAHIDISVTTGADESGSDVALLRAEAALGAAKAAAPPQAPSHPVQAGTRVRVFDADPPLANN